MPDAYMMSLRKPWAELTVTGEKTMELRRTGCAIPPGSTVYIYESGTKGRRAIVGSVVLDGVDRRDALGLCDHVELHGRGKAAAQHRVDPLGVLRYACARVTVTDGWWRESRPIGPADIATWARDDRTPSMSRQHLTCIHWRTGSAVRFAAPIPAPCKAVPTWRKLRVGEKAQVERNAVACSACGDVRLTNVGDACGECT